MLLPSIPPALCLTDHDSRMMPFGCCFGIMAFDHGAYGLVSFRSRLLGMTVDHSPFASAFLDGHGITSKERIA